MTHDNESSLPVKLNLVWQRYLKNPSDRLNQKARLLHFNKRLLDLVFHVQSDCRPVDFIDNDWVTSAFVIVVFKRLAFKHLQRVRSTPSKRILKDHFISWKIGQRIYRWRSESEFSVQTLLKALCDVNESRRTMSVFFIAEVVFLQFHFYVSALKNLFALRDELLFPDSRITTAAARWPLSDQHEVLFDPWLDFLRLNFEELARLKWFTIRQGK